MRHILFLLFMAFTLQAIAQYPATGNKARLGWQTTGDGLVYRGAIGDTATLDPSGINNAWMLLDTANGNLYAYRAKAWRLVSGGGGSVSDTLTGEVKGPLDSTYIDTVANIIFTTTTDTTVGVGELEYNDTQGSLIQGLKGGNVTNVIGQQIHQRVTNTTGGPLTKGTAVFLHGSQGNRITVRKALATADSTSANTFGIVAESIADNQSGYVITEGLITNINTNALTEGAAVYLSPTVAGELTTTKPQAPQHTVYIGVCVKQNAGSGELFVKIRNGQELDELHDVLITSPASNASLYYNTAQGVWRDTTAAALKSDISGTTNYIAKFTGSNTVGNSVIQDNGTNVGISASPSSFKLDINGSTHTTGDFYADRAARSASAGFVSAQTNNRWLAGMISNSGSWHVYDLLRSTSVMTLDSATGNVGINTTTPAHRLDVNGDVNTTGMYKKSGTDIISGTTNYIPKFTGANTIGNSGFIENGKEVYLGGTTNAFNFSRFSIYYNPRSNGFPIVSDDRKYAIYTGAGDLITPSGGWSFGGKYNSSDELTAFASIQGKKEDLTQSRKGTMIFSINDDAPGDIYPKERMRITSVGNVGIATSSPSRPLHVNANTSMIIPSGATGTRPASGADGDLRYSTTFSNIEFYRTNRWMRPLVGTVANNKVAFASGDTLTSNTNFHWDNATTKLGIGNAAPDSTLTVTGGIRATTGVRATRFTVNTSSTYTTSLNNYTSNTTAEIVPNLWIGNGGASNTGLAGTQQGTGNVGVGSNALRDNTTGAFNLAFGADALAKNTTGGTNIAIGRGAGSESTQENNSIAIGSYALQNNNDTTGENITIGFASMQTSTSCNYNVAIGASTLSVGDNADENVAIGRSVLLRNTTGDQNIGIGYAALATITSGSTNIGIGYEAGVYFGNSTANWNQTSINSIYIGRDTRSSANGNSNEIVIGDQGRGNGSNTTTIGNSSTTHTVLQYGETLLGYAASGDVGDYRVQVNGNGYVSNEFRIGYTADQGAYPLQVNGQIFATDATIATSDARLKQDIEPLKSGLKEVLSLNPVTYTFKPNTVNNYPKGKQVGFLAQEIKATVQGDYAGSIVQEAGGYLGVADTKLIPLLVKAIQEQQAQIEALKKEIEALKNK